MGETTIIFGRILINGETQNAKKIIETFKDDQYYPWLRSEMFSFTSFEKPFYYREPVIGFAASYKNLEDSLSCFIIKFEFLLSKLEFYSAKLQMETEFYGTYEFFWKRKIHHENFEEKEKLIERPKWFFGHGYRNFWGHLKVDLGENDVFPFGYKYPIEFDKERVVDFNYIIDKTKLIELNTKIVFSDFLDKKKCDNSLFYPIFSYFSIRKLIDYGYETNNGFWIIKKQELNKIEI